MLTRKGWKGLFDLPAVKTRGTDSRWVIYLPERIQILIFSGVNPTLPLLPSYVLNAAGNYRIDRSHDRVQLLHSAFSMYQNLSLIHGPKCFWLDIDKTRFPGKSLH